MVQGTVPPLAEIWKPSTDIEVPNPQPCGDLPPCNHPVTAALLDAQCPSPLKVLSNVIMDGDGAATKTRGRAPNLDPTAPTRPNAARRPTRAGVIKGPDVQLSDGAVAALVHPWAISSIWVPGRTPTPTTRSGKNAADLGVHLRRQYHIASLPKRCQKECSARSVHGSIGQAPSTSRWFQPLGCGIGPCRTRARPPPESQPIGRMCM